MIARFYAILPPGKNHKTMCRRTIVGLLRVGVLAALGPAVALAAPDGCVPAPRPTVVAPKPSKDNLLHIRADRAKVVERNIAVFTGHVLLRYRGQSITADKIRYNRTTGQIAARGHVVLYGARGVRLHTDRLDLNQTTEVGRSGAVRFDLGPGSGRGRASGINIRNKNEMDLKNARYTTCPPGHRGWYLAAGHLDLDRASGVGTARDAHVDFQNVPLFFWPYLSFPLSSQRKSGFLAPRYGVRGNAGFAFALPYYWNIAPQIDDTLTPRFYSRRGLQWQNETRYLGQTYNGSFTWQYLPYDPVYGATRYSLSLFHHQFLGPYWTASVDYQKVSDLSYLGDFSDTLAVSSQTDLPQDVRFVYSGPLWHVVALASRFQNLDPTVPPWQLPYSRMPEIRFSADPSALSEQLHYAFHGQIDNFQGNPVVNGRRIDLYPRISFPVFSQDGFIKPELGLRQTDYALDTVGTTGATYLTRTLPIVSLDSGLYFDRALDHGRYRQTLEPRFYYLYIPYVNQNNFPNFDTIVPDFNFSNLFLHNQFFGADRIGNANQATAAVTTRLLGPDGEEKLRASIGRIFYFTPEQVTAPAGPFIQTSAGFVYQNTPMPVYANASDWVAEAVAHPVPSWYLRSGIQWSASQNTTKLSDLDFQYHPAPDKILNIGRDYIAGVQDEIIISAQWPVYRHWTAVAQSEYSLLNKTNLESYAGIQYNTCCWGARVYFHRQLSPSLAQVDSVMFQFQLTGLANLGTPPINPLAQGAFIFGNP
ncbi:MAG: LPS-assembly protein LptD [Acidiferrobacteraceae bacterium]